MDPQKIVLNRCYGGFGLSPAALAWLEARQSEIASRFARWEGSEQVYAVRDDVALRMHPDLIACVETLGSAVASGPSAALEVHELVIDIGIEDRDGKESVHGFVA